VPRRPPARRPGAPTNRTDVKAVEEMLDRRLRSDGETVLAFDAAFESIIEQVQSHCTERGELLARIREWLLQHVWWVESQLRTAQQQAHRASEQRETAVTELESLRDALGDDADGHKRASMLASPGGGRRRSSSMRRTVAAVKLDGIGVGLSSASGASGDDDLQRVLGVEKDKSHITDDAVLAHFGELSSSDCSSLLDHLVAQVGAQWDSSLLTRMLASCLAHLPADELTDLCAQLYSTPRVVGQTTVGGSQWPPPWTPCTPPRRPKLARSSVLRWSRGRPPRSSFSSVPCTNP